VRHVKNWMASRRVSRAGVVLTMTLVCACSNKPPEDPKSYVAEIATARASKDEAFKSGSDSPVPENRRAELLPLAYFPIDPDYKTAAALSPTNDTTVLQVPTSTGGLRQMRRVGSLEFGLKAQTLKLTAFVEVGAPDLNHLFVPFIDLTSGTETYPGGRYLDLDRNATGIYEIDFNRAYFPYCYYSPTYECPYPPPENRLKTPIRAGERFKTASSKLQDQK
jgi:uncharacterized protein (DUF1684 family)